MVEGIYSPIASFIDNSDLDPDDADRELESDFAIAIRGVLPEKMPQTLASVHFWDDRISLSHPHMSYDITEPGIIERVFAKIHETVTFRLLLQRGVLIKQNELTSQRYTETIQTILDRIDLAVILFDLRYLHKMEELGIVDFGWEDDISISGRQYQRSDLEHVGPVDVSSS